jgi:hypothetical protein
MSLFIFHLGLTHHKIIHKLSFSLIVTSALFSQVEMTIQRLESRT